MGRAMVLPSSTLYSICQIHCSLLRLSPWKSTNIRPAGKVLGSGDCDEDGEGRHLSEAFVHMHPVREAPQRAAAPGL